MKLEQITAAPEQGDSSLPVGRDAIARSWRGALLILLAASLLMTLELVSGPSMSDSFHFNVVWVDQFASAMRGGTLYPRWLPESWAGMGSPTFYFYPPLYFWVAGALSMASGGALSVAALIPLSNLVVLAASGLAMRVWLGGRVSGRAALIGAIVYMAAPYHLYAIYGRGAVAEACAYAMLPLVALALDRAAAGRGRGVAAVAISYCLLILSHLPAALLASVTLVPAWVMWLAWRSPRPAAAIGRMAAGGMIGLALASFYLVPALGYLGNVASQALGGTFYSPDFWFFANWAQWPGRARAFLVAGMTIFALLCGVAASFGWQGHNEARFWGALAIVTALLMTGIIPWFWQLPYVAQVQFPYRFLPIAEFAAISGLALARPRLVSVSMMPALAALVLLVPLVAIIMVGRSAEARRKGAEEIALKIADHRDAPEYLPANVILPAEPGPQLHPMAINLPVMPLAVAADSAARIAARSEDDGGISLLVVAPRPTRIAVRRHWFPGWRVEQGGVELAAGPDRAGLVSWIAPAGRTDFRVHRTPPALARQAAIASLIIFLLWLLLLVRPYWPKGAASPSIAGNDDSQ